MTTFNLQPAEEYVARTVQLHLNSDERLRAGAVQACIQAITEGSGTGPHAELYAQAHKHQDGEYLLYCRTAGLYVADYVLDEIGYDGIDPDTPLATALLVDLLNLGQPDLWAEVADSFMPDPEDLED